MTRRALRENGSTVSKAAVSALIVLLGRRVITFMTALLSLETKVTVVSLVWVGLYPLQRILVGKRRRSGHWLVDKAAMVAYYLPILLAFYAANVVCSSGHSSESTPRFTKAILFMFSFTLYASSGVGMSFTNMTAYSLRDSPLDHWRFVLWIVHLSSLEWEWAQTSSTNQGWKQIFFDLSVNFILALYILFANTSESTLDCQTKEVADYMKLESKSSSSPFFDGGCGSGDANSLQLDCCRYPFMQQEDGQWFSIKDLFQCHDLPNEGHQDIWLSYSLSRLLARRYYGFHCAEEGDEKVRRFGMAGLLGTDSYKRAFTIVEVQLAFLHDYFFTASLPTVESDSYYTLPYQTHVAQSIVFLFGFKILLSAVVVAVGHHDAEAELGWIQTIVTTVVAFGLPVQVFFCRCLSAQIVPEGRDIVPIYWRPIQIAFRKLNNPTASTTSIWLTFFRYIYRSQNVQDVQASQTPISSGTVYWKDEIGQYSFLQDYDRHRSRRKALAAWFQGHVLSQPFHGFVHHLPVEEEDVTVPDSVRKLVAETLHAIDGPPTNGTRSLKLNKGSTTSDWSWTCREETHTDTILIWHIATCYCDMLRPEDDHLVEQLQHHEIATALSRYCAYLVAFLPEFLPEHNLTTKFVFQRVLQEAQQDLGTEPMEEEEKRTKIQELLLPPPDEQTTFHKGVELGRQLNMIDDAHLRWKVMAEFWAETILYVAPSVNAEAHIEHLAKGGEFVTHLWAMLSNAGILKRAAGEWRPPPASTTTEPPTHQLMEALSSSNDDASTSSMSSPPIQTSGPPIQQTIEKGKQLLEDHDP